MGVYFVLVQLRVAEDSLDGDEYDRWLSILLAFLQKIAALNPEIEDHFLFRSREIYLWLASRDLRIHNRDDLADFYAEFLRSKLADFEIASGIHQATGVVYLQNSVTPLSLPPLYLVLQVAARRDEAYSGYRADLHALMVEDIHGLIARKETEFMAVDEPTYRQIRIDALQRRAARN
jgi:hypothetical protein